MSPYTIGLVAVLIVFAAVQLASVSTTLGFGNGTYYVRDALTFADGKVAYSRYSPGLPLLLTPIVWATGGDPGMTTLLAEILMVGVAVAALVATHRVVLRYATDGVALALVAALALGQTGRLLAGVNPEPLVLALIALTLLLPASGRGGVVAAVLAGLAVLTRVALAPFFAVVWLLRLRRHPRTALVALALITAAGLASFATGPRVDQSYVQIAGGVLDQPETGAVDLGASLQAQVTENLVTYGRFGVPRLIWPFRLLDTLPGLVVAGATLIMMGWGLVTLRSKTGGRMRLEATAGTLFYLGMLLVWPIRASEAVRLVVPVAPILLASLGIATDRIRTSFQHLGPSRPGWTRVNPGNLLGLALVALVALNLAAGWSAFAQNRVPDPAEEDFRTAHRIARTRSPGPIISQKPAVSELILGVPAYGYPLGDPTPAELARFSEQAGVCHFALDGVEENAELYAWVEERIAEVLAEVGDTRVVRIASDWCP